MPRYIYLFVVTFFLYSAAVTAQSAPKKQLYRLIIQDKNGQITRGILYSVTDSTVRFVPNTQEEISKIRIGDPHVLSVRAEDIQYLTIRPRGQYIMSVLGSTLAGCLIAVKVLANNGPAKDLPAAFAFGGLIGAPIGLVYGLLAGIGNGQSVFIGQSPELLKENRYRLESNAYQPPNRFLLDTVTIQQ